MWWREKFICDIFSRVKRVKKYANHLFKSKFWCNVIKKILLLFFLNRYLYLVFVSMAILLKASYRLRDRKKICVKINFFDFHFVKMKIYLPWTGNLANTIIFEFSFSELTFSKSPFEIFVYNSNVWLLATLAQTQS